GFVGLMLPHAARLLVGAEHRRLLPVCALLGALFWAWRRPALRRSLGVGASLGLAFWLLGSLGLGIYERGTRLPELSLRNAAGESVQLAD
ncbi:iron chelate uptake ABC transporter family permease subunit, partial [Salmonella sp. SAL04269]|uniref:iron chelate uptake ABC transporter family permease subunit n=1 Tax=Salmonella sp. SAL04269 TaxID=3159847 RepID=UPI00397A8E98